MPTWFELERRFRDLGSRLAHARLDRNAASDGSEEWRVAAFGSSTAARDFEMLSRLAGQKLLIDFRGRIEPEIAEAPSAEYCWYRTLRSDHRFYSNGGLGWEVHDDGTRGRTLYSGTIDRPAEVAASKCLELATMSNEANRPETAAISVHGNTFHGDQARINVASTDASNNAIQSTGTEFLQDLRAAVERSVDDADRRAAMLQRIAVLESHAGKPAAYQGFRELIELGANWVTTVTPFLPQLVALLPKG